MMNTIKISRNSLWMRFLYKVYDEYPSNICELVSNSILTILVGGVLIMTIIGMFVAVPYVAINPTEVIHNFWIFITALTGLLGWVFTATSTLVYVCTQIGEYRQKRMYSSSKLNTSKTLEIAYQWIVDKKYKVCTMIEYVD